ncbi:hypothetical protein [Motilimonas eburnea]|uniref:hypothetical protein n=1 Tax=Motilimonas eburnea TaxID=1737488 RepID=UPI001E3BFCCA|nr:hypothetical protein [Motilimonas eburnea]MCE2570719.1 hypothetical protein [Motilimonas eburnea]
MKNKLTVFGKTVSRTPFLACLVIFTVSLILVFQFNPIVYLILFLCPFFVVIPLGKKWETARGIAYAYFFSALVSGLVVFIFLWKW